MAPRLLAEEDEVLRIVDEARREVKYVVTDFAIETLIGRYRDKAKNEGDVYVPEYQRSLSWNREKMSYFIESMILRIPVPPIFFYEVEGLLEIVDGSQRVRTLVNFTRGEFRLHKLEKLDILNGYKYSDLPSPIQRRLLNTPIRSFVLDQGTDESTRIDLFRRLNTSGKKLEDSEIRKGAYRGKFLDLVLESSKSDLLKTVLPEIGGGADADVERQELVTRFYIYSKQYQDFKHDVRKFLDEHMIELNKSATDDDLAEMRAQFDRAMAFVAASEPRAFYREETGRRVPRVRFEAIAVGVNLALQQNPNLPTQPFAWLSSDEFQAMVRTDASNSGPRLRGRIEFVRDRLLG